MYIEYKDVFKNISKISHAVKRHEPFSVAISGYRSKIAKDFIPIYRNFHRANNSPGLFGSIKYLLYSILVVRFTAALGLATMEPVDIQTREEDGTLVVLFIPKGNGADANNGL